MTPNSLTHLKRQQGQRASDWRTAVLIHWFGITDLGVEIVVKG